MKTYYNSKRPRRMNPTLLQTKFQALHQKLTAVQKNTLQQTQDISKDPVAFCKTILGFTPFTYQTEFINLFQNNQFTAARWCRQSGKSYIISALLLWYAIINPNTKIGIVAPSFRQSKRILSRITNLTHKLPPGLLFRPQKTLLHFTNNSTIEAFPNSPETIRGPTLEVIYIDECNFIANDIELYDAVLFTLSATNGKFVCASTPWNSDSIFYKIFYHKNFSHFSTSHITYEQALAPNGPLKSDIVEKIRVQMGDDPSRWRREMLAEWAEDDDVWLTQSLIANCIGTTKTCNADLQEYDPEKTYEGEFFAGLDLAQTRDYTVLAVVERQNDILYLRHLKIFKQPTLYASVLGYLKMLQDRWGGFAKIRVDFTREGPSIINDMSEAGIENAEGVTFSVPRKSEIAHLLRTRMRNQRFFYPMLHWERPYRGDLCTELNIERYTQRKDGQITYYHPSGTHDDVWWAIALAVYATTNMNPEPALMIIPN